MSGCGYHIALGGSPETWDEIEKWEALMRAASVDTLPKGQDAKQGSVEDEHAVRGANAP